MSVPRRGPFPRAQSMRVTIPTLKVVAPVSDASEGGFCPFATKTIAAPESGATASIGAIDSGPSDHAHGTLAGLSRPALPKRGDRRCGGSELWLWASDWER
jgi:hypothetical protein